ncbi:MAG: glycosyltransferase family 4 protein [Candidatus Angelobacter sp.]
MKLWIINHYAIPPADGGNTRHYNLAAELNRRGHKVALIASSFDHWRRCDTKLLPRQSHKIEEVEGIPFLWLRTPAYNGYARRLWNMAVFALRLWFGKGTEELERPDVIIGSSLTLFAAFAALRVARRLRVPFVLEIRDVWPQTLIDFGMSRWNPVVQLFGWIERHLYYNADAIVSLLPGAIEHMRAHGAAYQSIVWLPNGVDLCQTPMPRPKTASGRFRVVFAGSHSSANPLEVLLGAAEMLQQRGRSDVEFVLVGNGPTKAGLKVRAESLGLANVRFQDPVAKKDVYRVLAEADAVIALLKNLQLYRFGMSLNKLYDYMAAARPVLFSANVIDDPVAASGCGIVVEPENSQALADAIELLAGMSDEQRWAMGIRGRKFVEENHDFVKLGGKLEHLLLEVVGQAAKQVVEAHAATV